MLYRQREFERVRQESGQQQRPIRRRLAALEVCEMTGEIRPPVVSFPSLCPFLPLGCPKGKI
jgi:hypothetical protein